MTKNASSPSAGQHTKWSIKLSIVPAFNSLNSSYSNFFTNFWYVWKILSNVGVVKGHPTWVRGSDFFCTLIFLVSHWRPSPEFFVCWRLNKIVYNKSLQSSSPQVLVDSCSVKIESGVSFNFGCAFSGYFFEKDFEFF